MKTYFIVFNLKPQKYGNIYTQTELSQIDLVFNRGFIASGLNGYEGLGVSLNDGDIVYLAYKTAYEHYFIMAKIVVGKSYFNGISNWFSRCMHPSFFLVSSKFNNLNKCSSVEYPTKVYFIKKKDMGDFGSSNIQPNVFYEIENSLIELIEEKYQLNTSDFLKSVGNHKDTCSTFKDLFFNPNYLIAKKETTYNRLNVLDKEEINKYAFYDIVPFDYAKSVLKTINLNFDKPKQYRGEKKCCCVNT